MEQVSHTNSGLTGAALFAIAILIFLYVTFTRPGDATAATLTLAAVACAVGGIFALTLTRENPIAPEVSDCLATSYTYAVSRVCTELGAEGNAFFIPTDRGLWQFAPADRGSVVLGVSQSGGPSRRGILLLPAAAPLLSHLEEHHALILPSGIQAVTVAIKEILVDTLELADRVAARHEQDRVIIDITGYRLFSGCAAAQARAPGCCTLSPCPVCSLVACVLAKSTGKITTLDGVTIDAGDRSVHLQLGFLEVAPAAYRHARRAPAACSPRPAPGPATAIRLSDLDSGKRAGV